MYLHYDLVSNKIIKILELKAVIIIVTTDSYQIRIKFAQELLNKFFTLEFLQLYNIKFVEYIEILRSPPDDLY